MISETKKKEIIRRFDNFCKCIDFGKCCLTNEAIVFMNDMFMGTAFEENN